MSAAASGGLQAAFVLDGPPAALGVGAGGVLGQLVGLLGRNLLVVGGAGGEVASRLNGHQLRQQARASPA